jgi:hypothetical protein
MDKHLPEAALDLGCTPIQAFFKVEIHAILPGIITGLMMAFTLSLDDFVISFFTSGSDFQTLPLLIYSMTKKEVTPDMYALSTIMMVAILALLLITNLKGEKEERKKADAAYAEFKVPWSLTFNYSVRYSYGKFNEDIMEYDRKLTHNLSLSGRINLTPTWAVTMSTYYDITNNSWSYLNCTISKDLHCWQMSASFVPIGRYSTYNFMIGVKSTLLKDLKYEKQSDAGSQVKWY